MNAIAHCVEGLGVDRTPFLTALASDAAAVFRASAAGDRRRLGP
jgi:hypothetical protein